MNILILGAGVYGQALGQVLADNAHHISFYDPFVKKLSVEVPQDTIIYDKISLALNNTPEIIVLCTPSDAIKDISLHLPTGIPLIIASKGILDVDMFNEFDYMVLSGAGFAEDIVNRNETRLTATDNRIVELFTTDYLTFDETTDVKGVLFCGALKNVFALGAGMRDLKPGTDSWEDYIKNANREMEQILIINDAEPNTLQLSCGVSDLIVTCSPRSRNYTYGKQIHDTFFSNSHATNHKDASENSIRSNVTIEGLNTISEIEKGVIKLPEDTPILNSIINQVSKETK